ncbi:MAG TPA: glycosyltransferase family 2 protein [Beijerinckiaceae bacterium]|jgi:hypothetical protein
MPDIAARIAVENTAEIAPSRPAARAEGRRTDSDAWHRAALAYADLLGTPAGGVAFVSLRPASREALRTELVGLGREAIPGDMVAIEVPAARAGITREDLATALFAGGFEAPLIWAGRDLLKRESRRNRPVIGLISSAALGDAPRRLPGLDLDLAAARGSLVAVARRADAALPQERPWRLSVLMPVFNEKANFRTTMERLLAKEIPGFEIEICLVESNSRDGTRDDVLAYKDHPRVRLLLEDKPSGKGHAVRAALALATGDVVLIQDADSEYDIADYDKLLRPIRDLEASFVLGSRHKAGEKAWNIRSFEGQRSLSGILNLGHLVFAGMLNAAFGERMRDPFTMYKVFRRDAVRNVRFECNRFDFDLELVAKLIRMGRRPIEIDVSYHSRSFEEGKKVSFFRDPPTWVRACLKHRFSPLFDWH